MRSLPKFLLAVAFTLVGSQAAHADFIVLHNTGVLSANNNDGTNATVLAGGVLDTHYTVQLPGGGPFLSTFAAANQPAYFRPAGGSAQYINPFGNAQGNDPAGNYVYQTTFDLSGLVASTATISGRIYVDNSIVDILVNGQSTGFSGGGFSAGQQLDFLIPAGFVGFQDGVNTLSFLLNNAGAGPNPEAIYVTSLVGTADAVAVPEPGTVALLGLMGVGLLVTHVRRRRQRAKPADDVTLPN